MDRFDEYIKPFVDELSKYANGVHRLNKGVNLETIESCEEKLGVHLPEVYKRFLMMYNGGELFAVPAGTTLTEIYVEDKGPKKSGVSYLDESLDKDRRWENLPDKCIIIADTCEGDAICLNLSRSNGDEAIIEKWNYEEQEVIESWDTLIDWLMDEMKIGAMITNYDGTDKE